VCRAIAVVRVLQDLVKASPSASKEVVENLKTLAPALEEGWFHGQ